MPIQSKIPWYRTHWMVLFGIAFLVIGQIIWFAWRDQPGLGIPFILAGCATLLLPREPIQIVNAELQRRDLDSSDGVLWQWSKNGLLLTIGTGIIAFVSWRSNLQLSGNVWILLLLWMIGIAITFCALIPTGAIRNWIKQLKVSVRADRREWLFVFILFFCALFLRVVSLDKSPSLFAEDEGYFSLQAANIATVSHWEQNPFTFDAMQQYHPMLFHTLQALSIELFGHDVVAPRLPSAFIGALTIPGLYLAARRMFDKRVAVIAAIFLVTFTQHLHFSRIAINNIVDTTSAIWLLAFLTSALRTGDLVEYGLAGVTLGLSQYGASPSRLLPILALAYIGLFVLARHITLRKDRFRLLVMLVLAAVIVLPEAYSLLSQHLDLFPRLLDTATWEIESSKIIRLNTAAYAQNTSLVYWIHQLTQSFLGFVQAPDTAFFYGKFDPFLGWIAPIFFLIGLMLAIRHMKDPRWVILIIWWILTAIVGGALLLEPPQYQRLLIVAPGLAIVVAIGVIYSAELLAWLSRTLTPQQPIPQLVERWGIPIVAIVLLALFNLKTYMIDYPQEHGFFSDYRTYVMNWFADKMLPSLAGYKIWYFSNGNVNLGTSPILQYKVPNVAGAEYTIPGGITGMNPTFVPHLENLVHDLNAYKGKQAVAIAPNYVDMAQITSLMSQIPGATRWELPDPLLHVSVIIYYWGT